MNNTEQGIYLNGANPEIRECNIQGNGDTGITCTDGSLRTITGNTFASNGNWGVYYLGSGILAATDNYWGDASGPLDSSDDRAGGGLYNPSGLGNKVNDHVLYYPWTGTGIGLTATPSGFGGTTGISSLKLQWNANTEASLGG